MSDEPGGRVPAALRGPLTEWVRYLKEIGVRELRVPASLSSRSSLAQASPQGKPVRPRPSGKGGAEPQGSRPKAGAVAGERPATSLLVSLDQGFDKPPAADPAARLLEIRDEIGDCTRCPLHERRTNIVFGVGSPRAKLMFVGEGPGENEDLQGEPFVGRAGKKLDEMIVAIALTRAEVYIANIVKCRPPGNRDPERIEIDTCSPFLEAQIEAIRPEVIITLGGPATKLLLNTRVGITRLRGQWQSYRGIPVMPTFHPAYVLRNYTPQIRRQVFDDLKAARARLSD